MQITAEDIQNTILECFGHRGLSTDEAMWLSRLELFWKETRLRRSDLLNGVAQLCTMGLLAMEALEDQTDLYLTSAGESRSKELLASGKDYWGRYLRDKLLPSVRVKDLPLPEGGSGRRMGERQEESADIPWTRN